MIKKNCFNQLWKCFMKDMYSTRLFDLKIKKTLDVNLTSVSKNLTDNL